MCGLWGLVNTKPRKFDYATFCTLGISNDKRGGDSCGYFIDGMYEYGTKAEDKYFSCFFPDCDFLKEVKESTIAFGHCRKASVGAINSNTAQPVILTNEKGKIEYVLMHNGTIYNYEELAKKYIPKVDITGMTDSQVMARIFYCSGYKALSEYNGSAVFVIADYRTKKPKILLFKGASKKNNSSKEETEERPLYFCIDQEKGELVFSSISIYLMSLRHKLTTWSLSPNCLVEFNGKDLIIKEKISRKDCIQNKKVENLYEYCNFNYENTNNFYYDNYISTNQMSNIYCLGGKKLNGGVILNEWGSVCNEERPFTKYIFFWDGVALKKVLCYRLLERLFKRSKLSRKEFNKKFNNLIRYLSIDGIYCEDDIWYKAISPTEKKIFTGTLEMLTSTCSVNFIEGMRSTTKYSRTMNDSFNKFDGSLDVDFKMIIEACKSLMK